MSRPDRVSPARLAEGDGATRPPATSNEPFSSGLKKPDQRAASRSVDEALKESFPASDPPSYTGGTKTEPAPQAADVANDSGAQDPRADAEAGQALHRGGAGNLPVE